MQYTIADEFPATPQRFWDLFFDDQYNKDLWATLNIGYELLEFERKGEGAELVITRKIRLTPQRELPGIMKKFVKGALSYVQDDRYTATNSQMTTRSTHNFASDRIDSHGVQRVEPVGEAACRRVFEGVMNCSIPLVGGKIEQHLVDEVKQSYRRATEFTRQRLS